MYVCGDASQLAPDVHAALIEILEAAWRSPGTRPRNMCAACSATIAISATSIEDQRDDEELAGSGPQPGSLAAAREVRPRRGDEGAQRLSARDHQRRARSTRSPARSRAPNSGKLMKFHGIYVQDDRDCATSAAARSSSRPISFLIRLRLPGGVCTRRQWLKLDELARAYGNGERCGVTTRQTFQLPSGTKGRPQGRRSAVCTSADRHHRRLRRRRARRHGVVNPALSGLHAEVYDAARAVSDHAMPNMRAYHEIWYGEERVATSEPEEPFLGKQYLPRKFKIGFVYSANNDIDVYTQDLGFIAIAERGKLRASTSQSAAAWAAPIRRPKTYPRLGDVIGFVDPGQADGGDRRGDGVQRDHGDRSRSSACALQIYDRR